MPRLLPMAVPMVRHRVSAMLAVACAILGGAAMITATGVLAESGWRSHLPAGRLGGADVVVAADQTFRPSGDLPLALPERRPVPERLVGQLGGLPGVTAAVGDVSFPAAVVTGDGRVVPGGDPRTAGHGWSSVRLLEDGGDAVEGTPPAGDGEVALDAATADAAGVRPGDEVTVAAAGQPRDYRVTAVVAAPVPGVYVADDTAMRLAGRDEGPRAGTVDLIGLRTEPGAGEEVADAVRDELRGTGLVVATGTDRGEAAAPDAAAARSLLILLAGSLAGVVLLVIGFVTAGALAVAVAGQRRELALMRAVGATPRQIRRLAAAQATVVAGVALVPGVALGYWLAERFRGMLSARGVIPAELPLAVSPLPALATVLLLALAVQVSARGAAWRTSRMPATEAVAESRAEPRTPSRLRVNAGLLLILAATTMSVVPLLSRTVLGASATSIAGITGAIGLALAGPALLRGAGDLLARRLRPGVSAPSWLAVANIRGYALRLAGVVSALAMAVVFVLTYVYAQTTVMAASQRDVSDGTLAEARLTADGLGGLTDDTLRAVRATEGVRSAAPVSDTTVLWSSVQFGEETVEAESALILTPAAADVLDLGVRSGGLADLTGDTVAVSTEAARAAGVGVGDRVQLVLGDGAAVEARVAAVYERGLGFGAVALSADLAEGHTTTSLHQRILVRTDGTEEALRGLRALAASRPGLTVEPAGTADSTVAGGRDEVPPEVWINLAVVVVLLGYLLLSIANKLIATTAQRRHEIATLRLTGTTPRQILAMTRREAAVMSAAALLTGLALSAVPLALLGIGFLDRPWPAGPVWLPLAAAATVAAVAFLTTELPVRRALRTPPAHALAERG